jgi:nucleotide-binding universal stress UspA family protein
VEDDREQLRVLIATDGSDVALAAARRATELFRGAEFVVFAAARDPDVAVLASPGALMATPIVTGADDSIRRALVQEAHDAVTHTMSVMADASLTEAIEAGEPGEEICRAATTQAADVIVVGSHGVGGIRRALLGSVSDHVVRFAPCPVLVVRAEADS